MEQQTTPPSAPECEALPELRDMSDEEIDLIAAGGGMFNAAGGIYATKVYQFAEEICKARDKQWHTYARSAVRLAREGEREELIAAVGPILFMAEELTKRPRPMCRDCADSDGTCPTTGFPCDERKAFARARAAIGARDAQAGEA